MRRRTGAFSAGARKAASPSWVPRQPLLAPTARTARATSAAITPGAAQSPSSAGEIPSEGVSGAAQRAMLQGAYEGQWPRL